MVKRRTAMPAQATSERERIIKTPKHWLLFGLAVLASLGGVYINRSYVMDDALITLRYSYNFAQYNVPIWNPADLTRPSMGYTSLLWLTSNTIPAVFVKNKDVLVVLAKLISIPFLVIVVGVITRKVMSLSMSFALKVLIILAIFLQFGYGFHVNSAMETILFTCLVLLTVRAYAENSYRVAYICGVLAFLTRPEGAILVGLLCFWDLTQRRIKQMLIGGVAFVSVVSVVIAVLHAWYGDILPNSFYIKQTGFFSTASLRYTFLFVFTLALPYALMAGYSAFSIRDRTSRYMWFAAITYLVYYIAVKPLMNVLYRYQWPVLVLLTHASLPTFEYLAASFQKRKTVLTILLLALFVIDIGYGLGAHYFSTVTGTATENLIKIGKKMSEFAVSDRWLVYHDAGFICYYSNWNTYETIGLTNRQIATQQVQATDFYNSPDVQVVLNNFDLTNELGKQKQMMLTEQLSEFGFQHFGNLSTLMEPGRRNFAVGVYVRDMDLANEIFQDINLTPEMRPHPVYNLYRIVKRVLKGR